MQAAGFVDDFWGFQAVCAGIYLGDNEQAHRAESTKSAAKQATAVQGEAAAGFFRKPTPKKRILGCLAL
ncbi:hypothetical protein [Helicobacter canis]|uniref:Uncharacterized protein n=1 Tax=Helicobacter canis TaxID=29419 RepID=A0A5M9QT49_9HELI|nr:hypothetical protein [Helicobacter canis]KAA8710932.1 hypothetical protein F4V45_01395 [Helicobacter canis]